ncbi:hypothetical protein Trydic_g6795 [Trypoxylus dichotomus]
MQKDIQYIWNTISISQRQRLSATYHPATNGLAEKYVQTFKQAIRAIKCNDINIGLAQFLLQYRKTPNQTTDLSPSQLMFNREIRSRLDLMKPTTEEEITEEFSTKFGEGERVAARHYGQEEKWQFGRIRSVLGRVNYTIELDDGRIWQRHQDQIRKIGEDTPIIQPYQNYEDIQPEDDNNTSVETEIPNTQPETYTPNQPQTPIPLESNETSPQINLKKIY